MRIASKQAIYSTQAYKQARACIVFLPMRVRISEIQHSLTKQNWPLTSLILGIRGARGRRATTRRGVKQLTDITGWPTHRKNLVGWLDDTDGKFWKRESERFRRGEMWVSPEPHFSGSALLKYGPVTAGRPLGGGASGSRGVVRLFPVGGLVRGIG